MNLISKLKFWYVNSRPYSIPITFISWLVIFLYSAKMGGAIINGLIALIGISLLHLATNLSDDYFDYKRLSADNSFVDNSKEIKCRYLRSGEASISDLRNVIIALITVSGICGVILFFLSGYYVLFFALAVLPIVILYSKLSAKGLGDFSVIIAYGPLMFEGVYYVMTTNISLNVLFLSLSCAMFVNTILYSHMLMDFEEDVISGKTTLCTMLKYKSRALKFLPVFYLAAYIFLTIFAVISQNYYCLISYCLIPLIFDLYNSLAEYNNDKFSLYRSKLWPCNLGNCNNKINSQSLAFLQRFIHTRDISILFMMIVIISFAFV